MAWKRNADGWPVCGNCWHEDKRLRKFVPAQIVTASRRAGWWHARCPRHAAAWFEQYRAWRRRIRSPIPALPRFLRQDGIWYVMVRAPPPPPSQPPPAPVHPSPTVPAAFRTELSFGAPPSNLTEQSTVRMAVRAAGAAAVRAPDWIAVAGCWVGGGRLAWTERL